MPTYREADGYYLVRFLRYGYLFDFVSKPVLFQVADRLEAFRIVASCTSEEAAIAASRLLNDDHQITLGRAPAAEAPPASG